MGDIRVKINNLEIEIDVSQDLIEKVFKKIYSHCKIIAKDNLEYDARGEAKKDMIRESMRRIVHKYDKTKLLNLLKRFGLSRLDEAPETMYDSIYKECQEILDQ